MRFLCRKNAQHRIAPVRRDLVRRERAGAGGIADDVDQAVERVQAPSR